MALANVWNISKGNSSQISIESYPTLVISMSLDSDLNFFSFFLLHFILGRISGHWTWVWINWENRLAMAHLAEYEGRELNDPAEYMIFTPTWHTEVFDGSSGSEVPSGSSGSLVAWLFREARFLSPLAARWRGWSGPPIRPPWMVVW